MPEGLTMKYFVLKPKSKFPGDPHALAARKAMITYADTIDGDNPEMADSLRKWVASEVDHDMGESFIFTK